MQSLYAVSPDWVAKWPDSRLVWQQRRDSMVVTRNRSAELWKQGDENLIRLSPPHTFASTAACDWAAAGVNLPEAASRAAAEIDWLESRPQPQLPEHPSLADLLDHVPNTGTFALLCTLGFR
jgi:hypothetical protein